MNITSTVNYLKDMFDIDKKQDEIVVALAGNPNTGKSTIFNSLTGLNQHTGNWPGKTVSTARGYFKYKDDKYMLVDLPGTYSLFYSSEEELVARDFICFGKPDIVLVVCDANSLERNFNLLFQIMELTKNIVLCINLIDEANKNGLSIDKHYLENKLKIPVILTSARNNIGIDELLETIYLQKYKNNFENMVLTYNKNIEDTIKPIERKLNKLNCIDSRWLSLRILDGDETIFASMKKYLEKDDFEYIKNIKNIKNQLNYDKEIIRDELIKTNYKYAEDISKKSVKNSISSIDKDEKIDNIVTSNIFGIPIMILLLTLTLWFTIQGANYPSSFLSNMFFNIEPHIFNFFSYLNLPISLNELLVFGVYRTLTWVIAVMLPPMAIFFPIFIILEDLGYLPRIAFNLDHLFKKACAHGKQSLTMCMGFGCNACGVIGCRIIESPRERLIAILTNNFVPCNGRFPTLITISTIFFASYFNSSFLSSSVTALSVTLLIIFSISITLLVSFILSKTLLKGIPSTFTLELPPYRVPQFGKVIYTSIIDRTMFVLSRAIIVAIPAGVIIWIFTNIYIDNISILNHIANFLNPFAKLIGLDGFILLAFILGFPANEIVIPILIMSYLNTNTMVELDNINALGEILINNGWTHLTALNVMLFSLLHWPCSTTLLTIKKETNSIKWTFLGFLIPTIISFIVCGFTTLIYNII